jgi:hypothetical protein
MIRFWMSRRSPAARGSSTRHCRLLAVIARWSVVALLYAQAVGLAHHVLHGGAPGARLAFDHDHHDRRALAEPIAPLAGIGLRPGWGRAPGDASPVDLGHSPHGRAAQGDDDMGDSRASGSPAANPAALQKLLAGLLGEHDDGGSACRLLDQCTQAEALVAPVLEAAWPTETPVATGYTLALPRGRAPLSARNRGPPALQA